MSLQFTTPKRNGKTEPVYDLPVNFGPILGPPYVVLYTKMNMVVSTFVVVKRKARFACDYGWHVLA